LEIERSPRPATDAPKPYEDGTPRGGGPGRQGCRFGAAVPAGAETVEIEIGIGIETLMDALDRSSNISIPISIAISIWTVRPATLPAWRSSIQGCRVQA
jgi:hypothetical protein